MKEKFAIFTLDLVRFDNFSCWVLVKVFAAGNSGLSKKSLFDESTLEDFSDEAATLCTYPVVKTAAYPKSSSGIIDIIPNNLLCIGILGERQ